MAVSHPMPLWAEGGAERNWRGRPPGNLFNAGGELAGDDVALDQAEDQ